MNYHLNQATQERVNSKDDGGGKGSATWLVTDIMKMKQRFGMGCDSRPKRVHLKKCKTQNKRISYHIQYRTIV